MRRSSVILPELVEQRLSRARGKSEAAAVPYPIPFRVRGSRDFSGRGQRLEDLLDAVANGRLAPRRPQFRDHLATLRYQHGFARLRQANVLRQSGLELFDSDDLHVPMLVTGSHVCKHGLPAYGLRVGTSLPFACGCRLVALADLCLAGIVGLARFQTHGQRRVSDADRQGGTA